MSFRLIAKGLFLLLLIGILMPMCCDMNGLQLVNSGYVDAAGNFAIIAIFASSIVGLLIGVVLLLKKPVPIIIDWLVTLFGSLTSIIAFIVAGFVNDNIDYFQSGVYVILVGAILILLAQIISGVKKET